MLQVGLDGSLLDLQAKLDEGFTQLVEDRRAPSKFIYGCYGASTSASQRPAYSAERDADFPY